MPELTVREGDCIVSIAEAHGLFWEEVWNDSNNSELRRKRKDPNVLQPGDAVFVREIEQKKASAACEKKHRFRRKGTPAKLKLKLIADPPPSDDKVETAELSAGTYEEPEPEAVEVEPLASVDYILMVDGTEHAKGTTGSDGAVEEEIPSDATSAELILEPGTERERVLELNLGEMDPADEISGARKRLFNLGYEVATDSDEDGDDLAVALAKFQQDSDLEATGKLDAKTSDKLKERHGS